MSLPGRLFGFLTLTVCLFSAGVWGARTVSAQKAVPVDRGLQWLKQQYQLDEPTFSQIAQLHRDYFSRCLEMYRGIHDATRPLHWSPPHRGQTVIDREALLRQQQDLCTQCDRTTQEYLRQVAALMPPEQGPAFLSEFTQMIEDQRRRLGVSP